MSSPRSTGDYLRHVLNEVNYILAHSEGLTEEQFFADETLKRAFVRSIEIVGEASKNIPDEFQSAHPQIKWRQMAGMRNRLIHEYFGVNYRLVWNVVTAEIPVLKREIERILNSGQLD